MCTPSSLEWGMQHLNKEDIAGKRVVEVGSYNVNGTFREVVEPLEPAEYIGTDLRPGCGVDIVCPAEDLVNRFGPDTFDVVISTSTLEHVRCWKQAVSNIKHLCKPKGIVLVTAPSDFPFHAFPNDFWRYAPMDFGNIFSDFDILVLEQDPELPSLVYLKARKPKGFVESDLSNYRLYSIVVGKRIKQAHTRHFFTPRYVRLVTEYKYRLHVKPRMTRYYLYVKMGVRLKIIKPMIRLVNGRR